MMGKNVEWPKLSKGEDKTLKGKDCGKVELWEVGS